MTASRSKSGAKARGGRGGYAPAKLKAARRVGLSARLVLGAVAAVIVVVVVAVLGTGGRLGHASQALGHATAAKMARLGFRVDQVVVEGATPQARSDVLRAARIGRQAPILDLDLGGVRRSVEQVGWVRSARVVRLLPDTVVISIDQRKAMAVWQHGGRLQVIDEGGHTIAEADPMRFSDLPLVVGEGANGAAWRILTLLRGHERVMQRLEALVRVDDRRWDIRLNDGGLIQLPARGEDAALIQLDTLDQQARILELGFERIDLRDPEMVAVRPREGQGPVAATVKGA